MNNLCIHIGTHKTATTAIQKALQAMNEAAFPGGWALVPRHYSLFDEIMAIEHYSESLVIRLRNYLEQVCGRITGVEDLAAFSVDRIVNPSYSRFALSVAKNANSSLNDKQRKVLRRVLHQVFPKAQNESLNLFDEKTRHKCLENFIQSNKTVADQWFGGNMENLFPKSSIDCNFAPQATDIITPEMVATLVEKLLQEPEQPKCSFRRSLVAIGKKSLRQITGRE